MVETFSGAAVRLVGCKQRDSYSYRFHRRLTFNRVPEMVPAGSAGPPTQSRTVTDDDAAGVKIRLALLVSASWKGREREGWGR